MTFTAVAKIVFVLVILISYQPWITLITVGSLLPSILVTRWAIALVFTSGASVQKAKAAMSGLSEEAISNVKTVKCFAEEANHIEAFSKASYEVFEHGRSKAYFFAVFFFAQKFFGNGSDVLLTFIISLLFVKLEMTVGMATAIMLYISTIN